LRSCFVKAKSSYMLNEKRECSVPARLLTVVLAWACVHLEKALAAASASPRSIALRVALISASLPSVSLGLEDDTGDGSTFNQVAVAAAFPNAPAMVEDAGSASGTIITLERVSIDGAAFALAGTPGDRTSTAWEDVDADKDTQTPAFLIGDRDAGRGME
jgi:hypothetical protein